MGISNRERWPTRNVPQGADLWFVTAEGTGKLRDIEHDPHVNLAYFKDRTREWVSVSGLAKSRATATRSRSSTQPTGRSGFGRGRSAARHA